jgi:mannose-6-phosphate isomerase class I
MVAATYRMQPVHVMPGFAIGEGYDALAADLQRRLERRGPRPLVVIDGFVGTQWDLFVAGLRAALERRGFTARWHSTAACFLSASRIDAILAPTLTDDPVFGRLWRGHLEELWDAGRVTALRRALAHRSGTAIVYGFGASRLAAGDPRVYVDVPKHCGQELAVQGLALNVGADEPDDFGRMYKRLYFVDWPMLNRIKRAMLPTLDVFVDLAQAQTPLFADGAALRRALHALARRPFRVKPWFAPGPWGGQWMKEQFGLPPDQPNYAWSFELIAPENGLLLGDGARSLECSFDYLLWQDADAVLGERIAARYGSYFPIRFDYLDTMSGTNLSCQVHPRLDYIRDEFGEPITQDETYYIVTCKPGARVYLGLRDDADVARFERDARAARDEGIPFDIADHVNSLPSAPGALFLIPSGTVHCSGANNLVLEISATPYIYTFKIYDYLRQPLNGQLRHVHLEHAFANLDATRTARWVNAHLVPAPVALREGRTWGEYCLGDIDKLFFAIHRLEFSDTIDDNTEGKFVALNLVDGERCAIIAAGHEPVELRFAESIVIPACVGSYTLRSLGQTPCKVVKAFVKG